MMLCSADFEELFPELFPPQANDGLTKNRGAGSASRWNDFAGTAMPAENLRREATERSRPHKLDLSVTSRLALSFTAPCVLMTIGITLISVTEWARAAGILTSETWNAGRARRRTTPRTTEELEVA